jgi:uncharacterized protein (TIGR02284 family)
MAENDKVVETLNDLVRINKDRIEGYGKAAKELKDSDSDLRALFNRMAGESMNYLNQLEQEVEKLGGEPAKDTTQQGKIYRAWMDVKATFTGKDRHAILASCEFGEDAAQRAYEQALADDSLPANIRQLISSQKASLRASHDEIKRLRDTTKAQS